MKMISRSISLVAASLFAAACSGTPPAAPPAPARASQILITIEAVAARRLATYGGPVAMPQLAAVAAAGTTYDDAITTTPVARPALVTILTGVPPDRSGVRDNIHDALGGSVPTIADEAGKAGFETAAFVATPFASFSSGLQRGFELFDGPEALVVGPTQHRPPIVTAGELAEHFKQWLGSRARGKPFLAWIHLADLNGLATPPPGSAGSTVVKSGDPMEDYDKALAAIDAAIGTIVSAAKGDPGAKDCGVLLVGTHAAYLGEGGRRGDAFWLADETLRVPLVRVARLSDPAADPARHDPRPTWLPDVAASLRRSLGSPLPGASDGVPLDEAPPAGRVRLAWTFAPDDQLAWPPLTAVKEGETVALFEASGHGEMSAVGDASAGAIAAAQARPALSRRRVLTESARSSVEHAGLKLGESTTPSAPPKDADAWLRDLEIVRGFLASTHPLLAGKSSRRLLQAAPDSFAGLLTRLFIMSAAPSEELSVLRDRLLARYPDRSDALHWAAHVSLLENNNPAAAALLDAAIEVGPVEPEMYYDRACVHALLGEVKPALDALDAALRAGYRNWDWIDKDPEMAGLRSNPEFVALMRTHGR